MKILVTGSKGFVGTETCKLLVEAGHEVLDYDIMETNDIRDIDNLEYHIAVDKENKLTDIDRILHLAAIARFSEADKDPELAHSTNVDGTRNVAMVAGKYHIPVVYASTGSVYMPIKREGKITEDFEVMGNSVYGVTKCLGENYVQKYAHPWIILRYAHLYGKEKRYHGLIGGFVSRIERGLEPTLYGGKQSNDFTYIRDVARANVLALTAPWDAWNTVYNIGTGQEITATDAATAICEATGYQGAIQTKEQRTVDPEHFVYDTTKAEQMLGFKAEYDFAAGLTDMFKA